MLRSELLELITNGESSGVDFKRDDILPERLARLVSCLLNFEGGHILLGVEDDGTLSGLTRPLPEAEEWVMNVCRDRLQPPTIPYWETIEIDGEVVGVITLPADAPNKPYKARQGRAWTPYIRTGTTCREVTREEEQRLYQASGVVRHEIRPVPGTTIQDLDLRRLTDYFAVLRRQDHPATTDLPAWERLLSNIDILREDRGHFVATVAGLILFGRNPGRFLPQTGITATAYSGEGKDYDTVDEETIRGPLVPSLTEDGEVSEPGVIDRALEFARRNMGSSARVEEGRRRTRPSYPMDAVREVIVNAVVHRDYTIAVTDVELSIYSNRLEVVSPGNLPNTVTVPKMRVGFRAARNELLKDLLRDYGYVEGRGMGIPFKLIPSMQEHNGSEPDLIEEDDRFIVRLHK
ncbi:MAG: putative DNA binding domain-containing protein [Chloroflexi bacterium]|nr:putative DNA binding domain-containing protein [Chloroflexota bacterium]